MHVVSAVCIDFLINAHKMYKESKVFQLIFIVRTGHHKVPPEWILHTDTLLLHRHAFLI